VTSCGNSTILSTKKIISPTPSEETMKVIKSLLDFRRKPTISSSLLELLDVSERGDYYVDSDQVQLTLGSFDLSASSSSTITSSKSKIAAANKILREHIKRLNLSRAI